MKEMSKTTNTLRIKLLPQLAWKGIVSNGNVYYPYLAAGIFSVFTYFVFASILQNDISAMFPKKEYAWIMLALGKYLLSIILLLFLIYANGFLVKRRRKEFGLYHILGLEKKHIGAMMFLESLLLYVGALTGGIIFGLVLSKLLFLLLLRVCRMPMDLQFVFEPVAFKQTIVYFGVVYLINYVDSLWQVGKSRPVELMSGSRKGEKEPKFLWLYALLGMAALGFGYYCSITSQVDSMIFINFFRAVFFVVIGTYLLFTSGSIAFLKWMKTRKRTYYKPKNFITVSGMLYRMKKSAASLSNICIFSTMALITLICTLSLWIGMDGCMHFTYPYDMTMSYREEKVSLSDIMHKINELEEKYDLTAQRVDVYDKVELHVKKTENRFSIQDGEDHAEEYVIDILTQDDYNSVQDSSLRLAEDEAIIFCSGRDFGYDTIDLFGKKFRVQEEIKEFFPSPKAEGNTYQARYMMAVKDKQVRDVCVRAWCEAVGVEDIDGFLQSDEIQRVMLLLEGNDEKKAAFLDEFGEWGQSQPGFTSLLSGVERRENDRIMYGSLLFVGILFGMIFFMCLILIMYYKQITEGYEDRDNFGIMQKVGMSDQEIHGTVHRQILMVFGLPLAGALLHTMAGMFMVKGLFAVISFFDMKIFIGSIAGVSALFVAVYGASYLFTAKTYYRIVKQV
ncbi:MAG: FtsX-like permease family protein [Lachnospiraceae bacterium]|nr:FtsX-like permease family protein [Lachnospiraceae bacterium]